MNYIRTEKVKDKPAYKLVMVVEESKAGALWIEYDLAQLKGLRSIIDEAIKDLEGEKS